jgi:hypothetical protein
MMMEVMMGEMVVMMVMVEMGEMVVMMVMVEMGEMAVKLEMVETILMQGELVVMMQDLSHHHLQHQYQHHSHLPFGIQLGSANLLVNGGWQHHPINPVLVQAWTHLEVVPAGGVMVVHLVTLLQETLKQEELTLPWMKFPLMMFRGSW